ncbi:hypothetical protein R4M06_06385 [Brachyspira pilosicoli]|uniref:hypothetical protein n=1 Tax=Brachyspira pilosicoli TaxID=52584 RepID=UPI003003C9DE
MFEFEAIYFALTKCKYKCELIDNKINIYLKGVWCSFERKDNKYFLFGNGINESFDNIWDFYEYLRELSPKVFVRDPKNR